jgi:hypothetical protein
MADNNKDRLPFEEFQRRYEKQGTFRFYVPGSGVQELKRLVFTWQNQELWALVDTFYLRIMAGPVAAGVTPETRETALRQLYDSLHSGWDAV